MNDFHKPVLLKETISALEIKRGKRYIDATINGGGHATAILKLGGKVLGIDCDQEAIDYLKSKFQISNFKFQIGEDLVLVRRNFKDLKEIALSNGFDRVQGILFDLGISSHQLESDRGFSFQKEAPLDMRLDPSASHSTLRGEPSGSDSKSSGQAVTAADLINGLTKKELYELFTKLAQEDNSWAISNSIVRARKIKPITTTRELANLIVSVYQRHGMRRSKIYPATKVFQALRIAVNDELNNLKEALPQALELLDTEGRLVAISFHSLEDRIVKDFAKQYFLNGKVKILTEKPMTPTMEEMRMNPRARSAKMRILEKI